jgi:hypothetical protein
VFGHTLHKMSEKIKKADEPEDDYREILAQCCFCGRFSFASEGEFVRCFPDGPSYCEEWLRFCQEMDIDASTACIADPRFGYWWPRQSPMHDLAFEAAKAIRFDDRHWERRIAELHQSVNTLRDQRIFTTSQERRAALVQTQADREFGLGARASVRALLPRGSTGFIPVDRVPLAELRRCPARSCELIAAG